jgi:hypothetical protein
MKIKTLTGHLTAREKQMIVAAFANGWASVQSKRLHIAIAADGAEFTARTTTNESDDWGRMRKRVSVARFATA